MSEYNPYTAPVEALPPVTRKFPYEGIGGWLILVVLHLVSNGLLTIVDAVLVARQLADGRLNEIINPSGAAVNPLKPILAMDVVIVAMAGAGLVFMVRKSRIFPKFMIAFYLINLAFAIISSGIVMSFPIRPSDRAAAAGMVGKMILFCCVWIPYMLVSKRVKATFVH